MERMIIPSIHREEQEFLAFIRQHRQLGLGRMMQIISREWYRVSQPNPEGILTTGECLGMREPDEQQRFIEGYQSDPLFIDEELPRCPKCGNAMLPNDPAIPEYGFCMSCLGREIYSPDTNS
jgi:hypothetical protein